MSADRLTEDHRAAAFAAQEAGALAFDNGDEAGALPLYRAACAHFRMAMEHVVEPESMRRYLLSLQALTVTAAVTGRIAEARMAAGTGQANADVARSSWSGTVFSERHAVFDDLIAELGGDCPVFVSDDPASWPFSD